MALKGFDDLQAEVTPSQRELLTYVWQQYQDSGNWPETLATHLKLVKSKARAAFESLDRTVISEQWDGNIQRYVLTLLGVFFSDDGQKAIWLTSEYLGFVRDRIVRDHSFRQVTYDNLCRDLLLGEKHTLLLIKLIDIGALGGGGGGQGADWSCFVPRFVDELPEVVDMLTFVKELAVRQTRPMVPAAFGMPIFEARNTLGLHDHANPNAPSNQTRATSMPARKRVFIGSSSEGKLIAEHIQEGLYEETDVTVWNQGVFGLSQGTLESLVKARSAFDYAALVLTSDDVVEKRGESANAARDNVIFELGFFMGALGRENVCIVICADDKLQLPSDLAGVTFAPWRRRDDGKLQPAVAPVCLKIRRALGLVQ